VRAKVILTINYVDNGQNSGLFTFLRKNMIFRGQLLIWLKFNFTLKRVR